MLGRLQLGQTIGLFLLTRNAAGTPSVPDAPPLLELFGPGGLVLSKEMPIIGKYRYAGTFLLPVFLGAGFSEGLYSVSYSFAIGGVQRSESDGFEIMPGGSADGHVMSMTFYQRPHANFVVQQLDSGKIVMGRNPTL